MPIGKPDSQAAMDLRSGTSCAVYECTRTTLALVMMVSCGVVCCQRCWRVCTSTTSIPRWPAMPMSVRPSWLQG